MGTVAPKYTFSSLHNLFSSPHHLFSSPHHLFSSPHHLFSSLHHCSLLCTICLRKKGCGEEKTLYFGATVGGVLCVCVGGGGALGSKWGKVCETGIYSGDGELVAGR